MTHNFGKTKILVVDDEKLIRLSLKAWLKRIGYIVEAYATVEEAVGAFKVHPQGFRAIISDIVMGEMSGFMFRDIIRGIAPSMPMFFLTALDPEEGSGFLAKIMEDPNSYYLPKSITPDIMIRRVQNVIASQRIEQFIERQIEESRQAMDLAAHVQHSMLPLRTVMTPRGFYTTLWRPKEQISGDLYEAVPFGTGRYLYVLGDIQGHGTSAALAMTAVQAFLKQLASPVNMPDTEPHTIANMLQSFFRSHLKDVSYMTALICVHRPLQGDVVWISCGAPDLEVVDPSNPGLPPVNPEKRGGMPIGLMPDTVYRKEDEVCTPLSRSAICVACTDGVMDVSRDAESTEMIESGYAKKVLAEIVGDARMNGTMPSVPQKFICALEAEGWTYRSDDITALFFGARMPIDGVYESTVRLAPANIEEESVKIGEWCAQSGWSGELAGRIQLVLEETLMNVYDHGIDEREKVRAVASVRLVKTGAEAVLTVWDCGSPVPSIGVAAGSSDIEFELINRKMSGRGRGRLIIRELCRGIERVRYHALNETVFHIPLEYVAKDQDK